LVSAAEGGEIIVWDRITGEKLLTRSAEVSMFFGVSFAPDGKSLVTPMFDGTVRVWDATSGDLLRTYAGHVSSVQEATVSPDGTLLASAGTDGTVRLWTTGPVGELGAFSLGLGGTIWRLDSSPDGRQVAVGNEVGPATVWDLETGELILSLPEVDEGVGGWSMAYSPDGSQLAVAAANGPIHIWDMASQEYVQTLTGHQGPALGLAFSPDGRQLATSGFADGFAAIWDLESGQAITLTLNRDMPTLWSVSFSPDGSQVATSSAMEDTFSESTGIHVWDAVTGTALYTVTIDTMSVYSVRYSPDGKLVAAGVQEGDVLLYDISSRELVHRLSGHTGIPVDLAFSPDGQLLASGSTDNTVKVWDVASGEEQATLPNAWKVRWSPDGTRIAAAGFDRILRTLVVSTDELMTVARSRVTRSFTTEECQKYLHVDECPEGP
jgi:WD40 repeat protein